MKYRIYFRLPLLLVYQTFLEGNVISRARANILVGNIFLLGQKSWPDFFGVANITGGEANIIGGEKHSQGPNSRVLEIHQSHHGCSISSLLIFVSQFVCLFVRLFVCLSVWLIESLFTLLLYQNWSYTVELTLLQKTSSLKLSTSGGNLLREWFWCLWLWRAYLCFVAALLSFACRGTHIRCCERREK